MLRRSAALAALAAQLNWVERRDVRSADRIRRTSSKQTIWEESNMLHLIWMFIVGVVVGAIARWIMPGTENMGIFMTGLLGIAGSFVGGFIARIFSKPADGSVVHPAGIILSIIGALVLLWAWSRLAH
jgi:uncharacterized membrane protein YeaQ/YmgE (transglycosylase-associated protein family)